eukprot:gene18568-20430_t
MVNKDSRELRDVTLVDNVILLLHVNYNNYKKQLHAEQNIDPATDLAEMLEIPEFTIEIFVHFDDEVIATAPPQTEEEILYELRENLEDSQETDDENSASKTPIEKPSQNVVRSAIEIISQQSLVSSEEQ